MHSNSVIINKFFRKDHQAKASHFSFTCLVGPFFFRSSTEDEGRKNMSVVCDNT